MITLLLYLVAVIVFVIAFFYNGVHFDQATDLVYLGLACFAAAHLPWGDYVGRKG